MLIYLQNPDATRVAGFNAWKTLGRGINKGEKGLQILAPSPYKIIIDATHDENGNLLPEPVKKEVQRMAFKVTYVFDISQTNGKELPELAHRLTGDVGEYERMMAALKNISPYPISSEPIEGSANGYCSHQKQRIVGAATNAATFPMAIIVSIKSDRPAVSFRHVELRWVCAQIVFIKNDIIGTITECYTHY